MIDIIISFSFCIVFALELLLIKENLYDFLGLGLNKWNDDACQQRTECNESVQLSLSTQQNSMEIYARFEYRFNFYFMA